MDLIIRGSNDNSTYVTLTNIITVTDAPGLIVTFDTSNFTSFTAYRYHILQITGDGANSRGPAELTFYETL